MKAIKHSTLGIVCLVTSTYSLYAANPRVEYNRGNVFFTDSANSFFNFTPGNSDSAYIFYGSFNDISIITTSSTAEEIKADFKQLGVSSDVYAVDATFQANTLDTIFAGKRGYLLAANNSDISSATQIAIVSNSSLLTNAWKFNATIAGNDGSYSISSNNYAPTATGIDLVLGTFAPDDSSGNRYIQLHTVPSAPVPEPSSFALLGLGATAFLFRRRK